MREEHVAREQRMTEKNNVQNRNIKFTLEKVVTENVLHVCYGHMVCKENNKD